MTLSEDHGIICASRSLKAVIETMKKVTLRDKKVRFIFVTNKEGFIKTCRPIGTKNVNHQDLKKYIEENIEQYLLVVRVQEEFHFKDGLNEYCYI